MDPSERAAYHLFSDVGELASDKALEYRAEHSRWSHRDDSARLSRAARLCGVHWQPVSKSRNVAGCQITETQLIPHLRPRHLCFQRCWLCQVQMMTLRRCRTCGHSAGRDTVRHTEFCRKKRGGHIVHMCEEHLKELSFGSRASSGSSEGSSRIATSPGPMQHFANRA